MAAVLRRPVRKIAAAPAKSAPRAPRRVTARVFSVVKNDATTNFAELTSKRDVSAQVQDPFDGFYGMSDTENLILVPPYNWEALTRIGKANSALNQCVEAYMVNIESYGYVLEYVGPGKETDDDAQAQKQAAISFLDAPSADNTLREIREKTRVDYEYTGNKYYEVYRNVRGEITGFDYVPSISMRVTKADKDPTDYVSYMRDPNDNYKWIKRVVQKNFRRYVQVSSSGKRVYFKEFGDPRPIDPKNGKVNSALAVEDQATEIYHKPIYVPGSIYGMPRWIGALPAVLGTRESEIVNLNFFRENAIPAMAVLISGGALTAESFDNISNILQAKKGKDAMQRILILEAAADENAGGSIDQQPPAPKIEMKPMVSERQQDGLFKDYEIAGQRKIRSTMRLAAIYTGDSEEYTKATAEAGQRVTENQVFAPERTGFDDFMNFKVFPTKGITLWRFKTMGPTTYDPDSLATFVDKFSKNGALSPNMLIKIANQVLDIHIDTVDEDWANIPFAAVIAALNNGFQLKSLSKYMKVLQDAAPPATASDPTKPVAANDTKPVKAPPAAVKKTMELRRIVRAELQTIVADLQDAQEEALARAA